MSVEVPLKKGLPFFDLQVELESVTYTLTLRWNERAARWFLDVADVTGEVLHLGGMCVVADFPIAPHITGREPRGALIFVDTSGEGLDPGFEDLGERVVLRYYTVAELLEP